MEFREWYNGQPYKGEQLAYNAWHAGKMEERKACAEIAEIKGMNQNCAHPKLYRYGTLIGMLIAETIRARKD